MSGATWEVVGGSDRGGILVRTGRELNSPQELDRLSCGALVKEHSLIGDRLRYERLTGTGPPIGWVSTRLKEKVLLELRESGVDAARKPPQPAEKSAAELAAEFSPPSQAPPAEEAAEDAPADSPADFAEAAPAADPAVDPEADEPEPAEATEGEATDRRRSLVEQAMPKLKEFPFPSGKNFGKDGKMKMLFLYGGGTNAQVGQMQVQNVFKDVPGSRDMMTWEVFEAPTKIPVTWHLEQTMQQQLAPFGPDFFLYFDRKPQANAQDERWDGVEKTFKALKEHFKKNGPYDGVCGFDMGGEVLLHVARMAQEGDKDVQEAFRFMVLFTTGTSKHLSPLGRKRPQSPLKIPAIISWSDLDANHPYTWYEETCLHFHPSAREVIRHQDGHIPPRLKAGTQELDRLVDFLDAQRNGARYTPSGHEDNAWGRDVWLPLNRVKPPRLPRDLRKRLLVIVDPMGKHDFEAALARMKRDLKAGEYTSESADSTARLLETCAGEGIVERLRERAGENVAVEVLQFSQQHSAFDWHCRQDEVPSRMMRKEDIISDESKAVAAKRWARSLLRDFVPPGPDERVAIVGLGTGAFLAYAVALHLIEQLQVVPVGLWAVDSPTVWPYSLTASPGALADCSVKVLNNKLSVVGPPWRWEVSTCGPFAMDMHKDLDDAARKVISDYKLL